jgi:hypothetical protein
LRRDARLVKSAVCKEAVKCLTGCYLRLGVDSRPITKSPSSITTRALSACGAAEHVYSYLLADMLYRSLTLEIRNKKTGEVETIELEADVENDESLMRCITLMGVAVKFMTEEQRRELEEWKKKNMG